MEGTAVAVAGPPGSGRSFILWRAATSAAERGLDTTYFSFHMPREKRVMEMENLSDPGFEIVDIQGFQPRGNPFSTYLKRNDLLLVDSLSDLGPPREVTGPLQRGLLWPRGGKLRRTDVPRQGSRRRLSCVPQQDGLRAGAHGEVGEGRGGAGALRQEDPSEDARQNPPLPDRGRQVRPRRITRKTYSGHPPRRAPGLVA